MEVKEHDAVSGRETTGHEWNGIKELDTPVPRGVLIFLIVTHVWAVGLWFLVPAWPTGESYTKGLLEIDQRQSVERSLLEGQNNRSGWSQRLATEPYETILADESLMQTVRLTGRQLFGDNCAACHGRDGKGQAFYPDLTDDDWLWGGSVEFIERTMRVGVNAQHPESRVGEMPAFGRDAMLDRQQVLDVAAYVYSLSRPDTPSPENAERLTRGRQVYVETCAVCHGDNGQGLQDVGAPSLRDDTWIYGGDMTTIIASVHGGRRGHMPTWDERLTDVEIRTLALYVHDLGSQRP